MLALSLGIWVAGLLLSGVVYGVCNVDIQPVHFYLAALWPLLLLAGLPIVVWVLLWHLGRALGGRTS